MGAAPLSWLAKIGGDTLKTKAKLLSSAINELHDDGQCKIVAVVDNTADNGKTVLITTGDNKTYSGTIANKKCEFLLPPKTLYTVQKVSSGSAEFTTKVEAGYGDCILVHLDTGYVEVKQGDIVGLDYIKAATADDLKHIVLEANAVKELNGKLGSEYVSHQLGTSQVTPVGTIALYDKASKMVFIAFAVLGSRKSNEVIYIVPEKYRPSHNEQGVCILKTSSGDVTMGICSIGSDGYCTQNTTNHDTSCIMCIFNYGI